MSTVAAPPRRPATGIDLAPTVSPRDQEQAARRRYARALAVALESLRRAEQRFDASAAVIDEHIHQALVAAGSLVRRPTAAKEVPA